MTNKELAMQYAKEITVAKLSQASPTQTDGTMGKFIGDMYEAIYTKIYEIASKESE
ncbi:hypothetical protein 10S9_46 [uncultured Caudovirales phage]|uniref:Uncharacterized protein n=1 Tax=uncultured Caudovirales phage TaxID=2100421 RepID=A0A2H4J4Z3_9CAUD|nr:hypothetical protein 10S9_46 [uncultured Caudovirales phage]